MITRCIRAIAFVSAIAALTSCSVFSAGKDEPGKPSPGKRPSAVSAQQVCGELLNDGGSRAIVELTRSREVIPMDGRGETKTVAVAAQMKSLSQSEVSRGETSLHSICSFKAPPKGVDSKRVNFDYGWTTEPSKVPEERLLYSAGSALVELDVNRLDPGSIYYKCRLKSDVTGVVKGAFKGEWNSNGLSSAEEDRNQVRILLASASKMSQELGCTNDPDLSASSKAKLVNGDHKPDELPLDWPSLSASKG
jgi:hypothetical protein